MLRQQRCGLSIRRACELVDINRSWYYAKPRRAAGNDTALQDEIEKIVAECDGYGYRRVTHELRRRGYHANHKRVLRIMREGEWLCRFRRCRRRTKVIPRFFDERSCLKLAFAALERAARRWQRVRITELEQQQLALLRQHLQPDPTPTEPTRRHDKLAA